MGAFGARPGGVNYAKNGIPVLVWIYGGGFLYGTNADPVYDGQAFAENYGVIVVNMNYRLGALGFMASTKGGSNYGLRDQNFGFEVCETEYCKFWRESKPNNNIWSICWRNECLSPNCVTTVCRLISTCLVIFSSSIVVPRPKSV